MIQEVGHITAIISEVFMLVSAWEPVQVGDVLTVFGTVDDARLSAFGTTGKLTYPKGKIRIVCEQAEHVFLAETFRPISQSTRTVTTPSPFAKAAAGLAGVLAPETREVSEEVPGPWSAELSADQSLRIELPRVVTVGDVIGRE